MPFSKRVAAALTVLALFTSTSRADVITVPQSALIPSTDYYTDRIGGGLGSVVVMTGGGNAPGIGDPSGRNDDGFRGPISLGFTLNFFGTNYTSFFANNNGNISFNSGISAYVPTGPIGASQPIMSIFFGDVDTRGSKSGVMHLRTDIPNQIIVTWDQVGYYSAHDDKLNSFQLVVRGPGYVIPPGEGPIGFFWKTTPWELTNTSTTVAVGFGDGTGKNAVILAGSNQSGLPAVVNNHSLWFNANLQPVQPAAVPEPTSLVVMGLAISTLFLRRRGKRRSGTA
ncbi:MAG: PEP-CTERM sorting domain-containing protein [Gemmataceae bacterium]|nr:PEP-CTERM sorting domain-containing protein [Gemmataceae bacterium]